jgi:hypothetical protein
MRTVSEVRSSASNAAQLALGVGARVRPQPADVARPTAAARDRPPSDRARPTPARARRRTVIARHRTVPARRSPQPAAGRRPPQSPIRRGRRASAARRSPQPAAAVARPLVRRQVTDPAVETAGRAGQSTDGCLRRLFRSWDARNRRGRRFRGDSTAGTGARRLTAGLQPARRRRPPEARRRPNAQSPHSKGLGLRRRGERLLVAEVVTVARDAIPWVRRQVMRSIGRG